MTTKLINGKLCTFLEAVPYKEGHIFCNGDEIKSGYYITAGGKLIEYQDGFRIYPDDKKIHGTSPNLKLFGVYEISLEEEVEKKAEPLAKHYVLCAMFGTNTDGEPVDVTMNEEEESQYEDLTHYFIEGYKAASKYKKFTEEDVLQALLQYGDFIFNQHKGTFSSSDLETAKRKILSSLSAIKGIWVEVEEIYLRLIDKKEMQFAVSDNQLKVILIER